MLRNSEGWEETDGKPPKSPAILRLGNLLVIEGLGFRV
jgi:hypothetical protein